MSAFNPDTFLTTTVKGALDTKLVPVPEGDWSAQVSKISVRKQRGKDNEEYIVLDLLWHVLDEEPKRVTGMDKPMVKQSIFLDITPEGGLDMSKGKNVQLGKVREAVGQNQDGKAWSPSMLNGVTAVVQVKHRPDEKTGEIYADVKSVAKSKRAA